MSAVGHCGDKAASEGFFGMLKRERTHRVKYPTLNVAKVDVFDYIERFHSPGCGVGEPGCDHQLSTRFNSISEQPKQVPRLHYAALSMRC
jgi:hypothetical protein